MSKRDSEFNPKSLAQHFEAPDGFIGCFGWICGYSADSGFLDDAVERFSRRTHAQRAYEGRVALALMLDPSNPQISPREVPGVLHLPLEKLAPFKLMHAKVAILGFRHETEVNHWLLRLIVSTGNWTRETLEKSLDLVWSVDLSSDELKLRDESLSQISADIDAAWDMLQWLQSFYDLRALKTKRPGREDSTADQASRSVESWIAKARKFRKLAKPQFFDNRNSAFLDRLPEMIQNHTGTSSRNYLAMGSGFYESSSDQNSIPSVLERIVARLKSERLLSQSSEIDVYVNPKNCQSIATSLPAISQANWKVREAEVPEFFGPSMRSLHAKFIFGASESTNSDSCNGPWIYLGSGNLTGPGFANKMSASGGNLEAGVVFRPSKIRWRANKNNSQELVTNYLPLQWYSDFGGQPQSLETGSEMPEPVVNFKATPVASFFWCYEDGLGWLRVDLEPINSFAVLDESGKPCEQDPQFGYRWTGTMPREVRVRWHDEGKEWLASVPVIDEYGRIAATMIPQIDIDEAWNQLENFPIPPDDEDVRGEDGRDASGLGDPAIYQSDKARYSARQMMQLIENIAAKQTAVLHVDWTMWCTRLEQCLIQAAGSLVLEDFKKLQVNPLSPLKHAPFRPDFAINSDTSEGRQYELTLQRVEAAWQVGSLDDLGVGR